MIRRNITTTLPALILTLAYSHLGFASTYTAAELRADCRVAIKAYDEYHHFKHATSHLESGNCIGFITGVIESHNIYMAANEMTAIDITRDDRSAFCIPPKTPTETIIKNVLKDIHDHPKVLQYSAVAILIDILKSQYPCKKTP